MLKRRAFVRRMVFAALATVFLDLPLPEAAGPMREAGFSLDTDEFDLDMAEATYSGEFVEIAERIFDEMWRDLDRMELRMRGAG